MSTAVSHTQRFINNPSTVTIEALLGLVAASANVSLLDFGKVIVRRDYNEMQEVKIISGGGSGHEPAFSGFVGKGMLTAAIQGIYFLLVCYLYSRFRPRKYIEFCFIKSKQKKMQKIRPTVFAT